MTQLSCRELVELISDYLEGSLTTEERQAVELHLQGCSGCDTVLEQFRDTIARTGTLTEDSLTPQQRATLLQAFRDWTRRER